MPEARVSPQEERPLAVHCSDGNCIFGHPGGMHTNGGCRCIPTLSESRHWTSEERRSLRDRIKALAAEVRRLRAEAGKAPAPVCDDCRETGIESLSHCSECGGAL